MPDTEPATTRPSVVFVVLDACRYDYLYEHGTFFDRLRESGAEFTRAIAPAGWSLPSHASLFDGRYPSSHGVTSVYDRLTDLPLLSDLAAAGYETCGISGNHFASPTYGFDRPFDRFYNTHEEMLFLEGLSMREYIRDVREANDGEFRFSPLDLLRRVLQEDAPLQSAANAAAGVLSQATNLYPQVSRVPVRWLQEDSGYVHDPHKNTEAMERVVAEREGPVFAFTNYMNTHRPYDPPDRYQRAFLGETLSLRELKRLDGYAHPFEHAQRVGRGEAVPEEALRKLRSLYAGEVCDADDELRELYGVFEAADRADETVFVVTTDHGENLYDEDVFGDRWMAHWNSLADPVARVPLVVHGPGVDSFRVEEPFSLRKLPDLITDVLVRPDRPLTRQALAEYLEPVVFSEFPSTGRADTLREEYPDIAETHLRRELVAGYAGEWKVLVTTAGQEGALRDGERAPVSEAPADLVEATRERLDQFGETYAEMPDDVRRRLEEIGYL